MKTWLPKNLAAACHASRKSWPPLIDVFKTDRTTIDCLAAVESLAETVGPAHRLGVVPGHPLPQYV
jgi:hypothetical protein